MKATRLQFCYGIVEKVSHHELSSSLPFPTKIIDPLHLSDHDPINFIIKLIVYKQPGM